ncbi:MAG: ATP-binding protein [Chloroflexota bacterium]
MLFQKATKKQAKLRLALIGISGSGKTFTALTLAKCLGKKTAVIDSEKGSASKYADLFDFDVLELENFHPNNYIEAIRAAEEAGYEVLIIDSLSHAWIGKSGALELADKAATKPGTNKFTAWRDVTPLHNELVDTMIGAKLHVIVTMRSKMDYAIEKEKDNNGNEKNVVKKLGMAAVQRDGMEYEFDVVGDMDSNNNLSITKTRCIALHDMVYNKPGEELGHLLIDWLSSGEAVNEKWSRDTTTMLVKSDVVASTNEAIELLDLSNLPVNVNKIILKGWVNKYSEAKKAGMALDVAVKIANNAYSDYLDKQIKNDGMAKDTTSPVLIPSPAESEKSKLVPPPTGGNGKMPALVMTQFDMDNSEQDAEF